MKPNEKQPTISINSLPEELRTAKRFFPVTITATGKKIPQMKQWNNPEKQKHAEECKSALVGFDICGHDLAADYMVYDFDHVLDPEGNFTSTEAEEAYNKIISLMGPTWAEVSISGSGVHIVGLPTPGKFEALKNDLNGVYHFPDGGKVETFYRTSGRYFLFTGKPFRNSPSSISSGSAVDASITWTKNKIAAQLAEKRQANPEPMPTPTTPRTTPPTEAGGIPDEYRIRAMLAALPCSECTYEDWVHVGMVIHDTGLDLNDWDTWSATDGSRYKGIEDLAAHWKTFKPKNNGVSIGTLYNMAVRFGYNAKATAREWYREHPPTPEDDFQPIPDDEAEFFNFGVLKKPTAREVFVCEDPSDARSIMECGAEAIATNGEAEKFVKAVIGAGPGINVTLILCLDPKATAAKTISDGLQKAGVSFVITDINAGYNSPAAALEQNREAFSAAITEARTKTAARPDNTSRYIDSFMGEDIERFKQERLTGFPSLDAKTGGLYPGLYVLAAISSLGKTSFCLQLADQLAARGEDVLFFSLEMSRLELVSKSLARKIAQDDPMNAQQITSLDIRRGRITEEVKKAAEAYKAEVEERLSIVEANFDVNISSIGEYVRRYMAKTNTRPAVFLDYLQIIQPKEDDQRKGKREALDNTVTELKRLSREIDAPFIVVSSVNRANYSTPIAFESLKETGGIEYSADVILGLQLQCISTDPAFTSEGKIVEKRKIIDNAKTATPRKIEMKCLKNRFGISTFSCFFDYFPAVDLFEDKGAEKTLKPKTTTAGRLIV